MTEINKLRTLTKEDFNTINKLTEYIDDKYGLTYKERNKLVLQGKKKTVFERLPKGGVYFSNNYDKKTNYFIGIRDKTLARKRADMLLNNKDKIEEYFNEHPNETFDKNEYIKILEEIRREATTEEIEEKEEAERKREEERRQREEAERQRDEERRQKEEAERQRDEKTQAIKDTRETSTKKLSDKTNEINALTEENERLRNIINKISKAPLKREYINDKVFNESYSLDKGELMDVIAKDINKGKLPSDADPEEIADAIYAKATRRIYRNLKRINNLTALTGYNPDLYNKLPPEVAEIIKNHINEKIKDDIRKKNIKYILPKDKPRWEHAMESKQLNPMLGRSAWRVN